MVFFQIPCLLSFSFPLVVLSHLLISILLDFSKCLMYENIGGLIKARFKNSTQTFFQGGSPGATWSSIVCLLWGPSIVSGLFLKRFFFPKSFSPFLCYSFCLLLSSILLASSLDFYVISIGFLNSFYGNSMIFYGVLKGVSMVVLWDSYGASKGSLWDFLWIPMGFLKFSHDISMAFLWDAHDISTGV